MDIIGIMYEPSLVEGEEPTALAGWHVNTPAPVEGWEAHSVVPTVPRRVYGGHPTFFYVFADEAEFVAKAIEAGLITAPEVETPVGELIEGEM